MWPVLLLLGIPIVEIALFIQVGAWIGLWATLGLVVLSALAGVVVMRTQSLQAFRKLRASVEAGVDPTGPIADGGLVLAAGVLLLIPGFLSDAVAIALLLPPTRAALIRWAGKRLRAGGATYVRTTYAAGPAPRPRRQSGEAIEADYEVLDDVPPAERGASGWTRPQS